MPTPVLALRVPAEEADLWRAAAAALGVTLTDYVRGRVNQPGPAPTRRTRAGSRRAPRAEMCVHRVPPTAFCSRCGS